MTHRHCQIRFTIECARDYCDRLLWNNFADERDTAPPAINILPAYVKPQIHLLEVAMEWNRDAEDARVEKKKTDHTKECFTPKKIEFCPRREQRLQDFGISDKVYHRQVPPLCGEKRFEHFDND